MNAKKLLALSLACTLTLGLSACGGGQDAQPRRTCHIGDRVAGHGAYHQDPFQTEVNTPTLFGQALSQANKQKRRTDTHRAGQQRQ